jgi:hypothetical protein
MKHDLDNLRMFLAVAGAGLLAYALIFAAMLAGKIR